ncbi:Antiviral helicase ski2 [Polyrhizophydium stewartii]|uniref:Antiviral helicase ski2 n=1 Tax=Polyrhizophydium stewartii TaxID=2732419 RepID=A0ABR4NF89_9FUNG
MPTLSLTPNAGDLASGSGAATPVLDTPRLSRATVSQEPPATQPSAPPAPGPAAFALAAGQPLSQAAIALSIASPLQPMLTPVRTSPPVAPLHRPTAAGKTTESASNKNELLHGLAAKPQLSSPPPSAVMANEAAVEAAFAAVLERFSAAAKMTPSPSISKASEAAIDGKDPTSKSPSTPAEAPAELPQQAPRLLASQFRITCNMILNLLRVEAIKVEDMIKRSFSENVNQKALPDQQRRHLEASSAALSAKTLESLKRLDCTICSADVYPFYDICARILTLGYQLHEKIVRAPIGQRALSTGRVVVVNNTMFRNALAVVLRSATGEQGTLPVTRISVPTRGREADFIELLPYTAIAVITPKIVKLDVERIIEQRDASEIATALGHLQQLAEEIQAAGSIPEYDWSKIREADFQDGTREKHALMRQLDGFQCTRCPDLIPHYGLVHRERMLQQQVAELAISISDQNLELLPDYHQRVDVLKVLGFVDANAIVQIKGRINTADELILTELILDNFFAEYEPAEIVALLSCFVFQEKSQSEPVLTLKLEKGVKRITELAVRIAEVQEACGLGVRKENALDSIKFGLVEVVYEWARGLPFKHITDLTDVLEGSIVRCIVRLSETCREVSSAARQIGDAGLYRKMEEAAELIRRDIVFAASLYF